MIRASAPGRVNLIGEHTDYNDGFVLPVALPLRVQVEPTPTYDDRICARSEAIDSGREECVSMARTSPTGRWIDHILGPVRLLVEMGKLDAGIDGATFAISSQIPIGAGLGSSGALGVAALRALETGFDPLTIARLAQRSENEFVGARSGIMDQLAASIGTERDALFIDCRSLAYERIRLPDDLELVVVDSGQRHENASGPYNERRAECEEAARMLGVRALRDVDDLARTVPLPEPLRRRARHVVSENARVLEAVAALAARDAATLGRVLDASHRSLRDDYEVSTPEVDLLVELLREQEGIHGARITGGGFGGCVVAIADPGSGHHAAARAAAEHRSRTGLGATVILPTLEPDEVSPS